ncbi:MAG TPA: PaaI family thioesterase [Allosphingosinicella sp.]|jgi:acyl-coenzyme A thioesterase PaaI-like protein|nr:PaaI family thioesterase [Allosphingosinicella sp.]
MTERRHHPLIRHEPDPDHPGWWTWDLTTEETRFNSTIGRLLVRGEGEGKARCRTFPEVAQSNLGNIVHGGAILTFIDMAMFAGGYAAGANLGPSVTLDLSAQFLSGARLGLPLDCSVEILRESKRLAVMRGLVEQEGETVAAWSGTLRKLSR